jgi:chemotaxis regulatin CheY-phosphate phosphatase CheZ
MSLPRRADELLYDSEASLRLVDHVLEDLGTPQPPPSALTVAAIGLNEIPALLLRANREINSVLDSLRRSRDMLEKTASENLQVTHEKLREVTSATEVAANDILDGLDRSLALIDRLDQEAERETSGETRAELRDEIFQVMGHLQFQDITSQQLSYASSVLLEMERRLGELASLFDPEVFGHGQLQSSSAAMHLKPFDPAATTTDAEDRQALVDAIFSK